MYLPSWTRKNKRGYISSNIFESFSNLMLVLNTERKIEWKKQKLFFNLKNGWNLKKKNGFKNVNKFCLKVEKYYDVHEKLYEWSQRTPTTTHRKQISCFHSKANGASEFNEHFIEIHWNYWIFQWYSLWNYWKFQWYSL